MLRIQGVTESVKKIGYFAQTWQTNVYGFLHNTVVEVTAKQDEIKCFGHSGREHTQK